MTVPTQENQDQPKQNDKEMNFRLLEQKLAREKAEKAALEREAQELKQKLAQRTVEEEDDDEPYVDRKKLRRELSNFGQQTMQQTQSEIQRAVQTALQEERKANWIKNNSDFYEVLKHAEKLAMKDPELADTILEMPEGFERQKLVYKNIKALGLDKPEPKAPSIQDKIEANKKSPYYQPTNVGTSPYSPAGDFSKSGQKNAYDQMQALKARLGIQ